MKYIRQDKESKVFAIVVIILLVAMIVVFVLSIVGEPVWKPLTSYPMANKYIQYKGWIG